ncbi:hypothetical protein V1525DRAFT_405910 [Lipomyces kononenkoae]|uniref:Uncharacterized protein n=1 Tax=Lipomyces kononenkoae TaxID=34357 RepID=A0ACC3T035_LIPKO
MGHPIKELPPPYEDVCDDGLQSSTSERHTRDDAYASLRDQNSYSHYIEPRYEHNPGIVYGASGRQRYDTPDFYSQPYHQNSSQISGSYEGHSRNPSVYGQTRSTAGPSYRPHDALGRSSKVSFDDVGPSTRRYSSGSRSGSSDSSDESSSSDDDEDYVAEAWHLHVHRPPPPPLDTIRRLRKLIVLPQGMTGVGAPICRAYPLEFAFHGISCDEFLEFVDKLNVMSAAHPPAEVLGTINGALAFVPSAWFSIAGAAAIAVGKHGRRRVGHGSTESFMKLANMELFEPCKLRVQLCNTQAVGSLLGLPWEELSFPPSSYVNADRQSVIERRLSAFSNRISPLTFQVPPPGPQARALEKLYKKQIKRQRKFSDKILHKDREKALKRMHSEHGKGYGKEMRKLSKEMDKVNRKAAKETSKVYREKSERKMMKEVDKVRRGQDKELRKLNKHMNKLELLADKEYGMSYRDVNAFDEVLWVVVTDLL